MVDLEHPDIMLLQEILGGGDVIKEKLENWFFGWTFVTLDVRGRSGGLAMGWDTRVVKALNIRGMESVLGMTVQGLDHGDPVDVFNIYGPYINCIPFWDNIFKLDLFCGELAVIGGDINFYLGQAEVWGPFAHPDLLSEYFTQKLIEGNWLDIEPVKLKLTWHNNRCGDGRVAK